MGLALTLNRVGWRRHEAAHGPTAADRELKPLWRRVAEMAKWQELHTQLVVACARPRHEIAGADEYRQDMGSAREVEARGPPPVRLGGRGRRERRRRRVCDTPTIMSHRTSDRMAVESGAIGLIVCM